jgi:hypothetical protein
MATSGTYNFTVTTTDLVRESMLNIGKLGEGEGPTPSEFNDIVRKLNMIVKQLQGDADYSKGLKMWTRRQGHLFLSGTAYSYNIGPSGTNWTNSYVMSSLMYNAAAGATSLTVTSIAGMNANDYVGIQLDSETLFWTTINGAPSGNTVPIAVALPAPASTNAQVFTYTTKAQQPIVVEFVLLRDSQAQDTPIRILNVQDYAMLPSKTDPTNLSDPTAVYIENQLVNSVLYLDVGGASDVSKHVVVGYMESIQDVSSVPAGNIEYPQEYFRAVSWLLSKEICPMFSAIWTPLMEELTREAVMIATNKDPEASTVFFQCNA